MKTQNSQCPYCDNKMHPVKMHCRDCSISIEGTFKFSRVALLSPGEAAFLAEFALAGFNIKDMEKRVGMSYPAIRSRLDKIIKSLKALSAGADKRKKILDRVEGGEIRVDEAIQLLEKS